jgi:hypothetical protein
MLKRTTLRRIVIPAVAAFSIGATVLGTTETASAWWRVYHPGWHGGWGWRHGWGGPGPGVVAGAVAAGAVVGAAAASAAAAPAPCPPGTHLGPNGHRCWPN